MEHFNHKLEGWFTFPDLYKWVVNKATDGEHFIEVGVHKGQSAAYMAVEIINSGKKIKFDCIDPFPSYEKDGIDGDAIMRDFLEGMKPVEEHYTFKHEASPDAANAYEDNSLDFVFIDGDHSYESVFNDVQGWMPKIKVGGVLAGHDYSVAQTVYDAVTDCFKISDLRDPWGNGCFVAVKTESGFVKPQFIQQPQSYII